MKNGKLFYVMFRKVLRIIAFSNSPEVLQQKYIDALHEVESIVNAADFSDNAVSFAAKSLTLIKREF